MKRRDSFFRLPTAALIVLVSAFQVSAADKSGESCRADPHQPGDPPRTGDGLKEGQLRDCNGVLHPPAVGDPDLVKPAPDIGKMPVIPPESVPHGNGEGESGQGKQQ